MTGPRSVPVHPHRRLGRRLLPFLIALVLAPMACTSDQPTEPMSSQDPVAAATGSHPRALLRSGPLYSLMASSSPSRSSRSALNLSVAATSSTTSPSVLILADADVATTTALADTLTQAGFQVTVRPAPEYSWDGTNPSLTGFDAVIHLDGAGYEATLIDAAQQALSDFVAAGGGYIAGQWNGIEYSPMMSDLVLQAAGGTAEGPEQNCAACDVTYQAASGQEGHPVLAGVSSGFTFNADAHDAGPQVAFEADPSTVLMRLPTGAPGVLVRAHGAGKVVSFSFAPNYPFDQAGELRSPATLNDSNIKKLYINAVRWVSGSATGEPEPQTIDFAAISDKVYGQPAFSIQAQTSSGLPVSFTASGECSVSGTTVSILAAGSCTITAHQAGNASYLPAEDVSRSFNIAKAPATILLSIPNPVFDGTSKSVSVSTNPAGLSGVSVTYSQAGALVTPVNAGSYQVVATLDHPNYQAPTATGTLTIRQATPVINWTPGSLSTGTPLGPSQLNATATGIGGALLTGSFVYNPPAGTAFNAAGTVSLTVQFTPSDPNYAVVTKTVSITVSSAMNFTGFFAPIRNMPAINNVVAGSAIPVKFAIGGYRGLGVLMNSPTSIEVSCPTDAPQNAVRPIIAPSSGLRSLGYSYTYVWRTNGSWGGTCRKFVLTLVDGSTHEALFRFTSAPQVNTVKRILGK